MQSWLLCFIASNLLAQLGVTSTSVMAHVCSELQLTTTTAVSTLDLWHAACTKHLPSVNTFQASRRKASRLKMHSIVQISDDVQSSSLPEHITLTGAILTLEEMASEGFQATVTANRLKRKTSRHCAYLTTDQQLWGDLRSSVPDLDALQLVAEAIASSDSGFIQLNTVREMVESSYFEHQQQCPWVVRPITLITKLLRYLPVITIKIGASTSGVKAALHVSARPPDGSQYLQQIGALVTTANHNAAQLSERLRNLPIKSYLAVMESERDRRVFKGLVTQITNPTFVRSAFNWQQGSISKITEDLDAIDFYISDVHQMLQSVDYCSATSPAVRKRLRKKAFMRLSTNNFLSSRKRGGRPSKIRQFE